MVPMSVAVCFLFVCEETDLQLAVDEFSVRSLIPFVNVYVKDTTNMRRS